MQETEYTDKATIHSAVSERKESTLEKTPMEAVSDIADILWGDKVEFSFVQGQLMLFGYR